MRATLFRALAALALAVAAAAGARADEVWLESGDLIHGEVVSGDERTLMVKHIYDSDIAVPWEKVTALRTEKPVELRLADGTRLKGKLRPGPEPRTVAVDTESAGTIPELPTDRILAINEPSQDALWAGRISLGITIQDGNTRAKNMFGSFDGERRTKADRIEARAYYGYGENEGILASKKGFARIQYAYYVHSPIYIYAGGALEYDKFRDLKLRSRGGGGGGYSLFETKKLTARLEGGVEYVDENFFEPTEDRAFTALRGAAKVEWQVTQAFRLGEQFEIFPSVEKFSDFVSRSVTTADLALFAGFGVAAVIIWEHDQIPAPGLLRNDTTYILTLTFSF